MSKTEARHLLEVYLSFFLYINGGDPTELASPGELIFRQFK